MDNENVKLKLLDSIIERHFSIFPEHSVVNLVRQDYDKDIQIELDMTLEQYNTIELHMKSKILEKNLDPTLLSLADRYGFSSLALYKIRMNLIDLHKSLDLQSNLLTQEELTQEELTELNKVDELVNGKRNLIVVNEQTYKSYCKYLCECNEIIPIRYLVEDDNIFAVFINDKHLLYYCRVDEHKCMKEKFDKIDGNDMNQIIHNQVFRSVYPNEPTNRFTDINKEYGDSKELSEAIRTMFGIPKDTVAGSNGGSTCIDCKLEAVRRIYSCSHNELTHPIFTTKYKYYKDTLQPNTFNLTSESSAVSKLFKFRPSVQNRAVIGMTKVHEINACSQRYCYEVFCFVKRSKSY